MALTAYGYEPCRRCGTPVGSDYGETLCGRCYDRAPRCLWCGDVVTEEEQRLWGGCHRDCQTLRRRAARLR